jgi:hypothetical protein
MSPLVFIGFLLEIYHFRDYFWKYGCRHQGYQTTHVLIFVHTPNSMQCPNLQIRSSHRWSL